MSQLRLPTLELAAELLGRLRPLGGTSGTPGVMYARISEDREGAGLGVQRQLGDQCTLFTQLGLRLAGVYADNDLSAFTGKPARTTWRCWLIWTQAGPGWSPRGTPTGYIAPLRS
jgi:hypothetical protein